MIIMITPVYVRSRPPFDRFSFLMSTKLFSSAQPPRFNVQAISMTLVSLVGAPYEVEINERIILPALGTSALDS